MQGKIKKSCHCYPSSLHWLGSWGSLKKHHWVFLDKDFCWSQWSGSGCVANWPFTAAAEEVKSNTLTDQKQASAHDSLLHWRLHWATPPLLQVHPLSLLKNLYFAEIRQIIKWHNWNDCQRKNTPENETVSSEFQFQFLHLTQYWVNSDKPQPPC